MGESIDAVLEEALALPEGSRAALVEGILASFAPQADVVEDHMRVIRLRKAEIESGSVTPVPGDIVAAEVRQAVEEIRKQ